MVDKVVDMIGSEQKPTIVADKGYFNSEEISKSMQKSRFCVSSSFVGLRAWDSLLLIVMPDEIIGSLDNAKKT